MLSAHHLHKAYGIQPILQDISFSISNPERVGLIGPNGCGKTTLMRILAGIEQPDSGTVSSTRPNPSTGSGRRLRIGYLAQGMDFQPNQTLHSALRHAQDGTLSLHPVSEAELEAEIASLASALSSNPNDSTLQAKYDSIILQFSNLESLPSILAPLGLSELPLDTPITHLSGGQKTRLMLARVLLEEPHLLLLDEPTNHLDIEMLEWLEGWLTRFNGAALIVSHDRAFLDNTVTSILELDPTTHGLRSYPGNYADYLEQKLTDREKQAQDYQDQQDEITQLGAAAAHIRGLTKMRKGGKADPKNTDGFSVGFFGNRATKRTAGRAKHIEARIKKILTEERIEKPRSSWQMKLDFGTPAHLSHSPHSKNPDKRTGQSKDVLITEKLSVGYDKPLLIDLNLHIRASQRIALTGPNGSGKTTLIRTIAGKLEPLSGSLKLGATVKVGYMAQEQELLDPALNALRSVQNVAAFNETEGRNFLHYFLFKGDDALRATTELSFGERSRLQLALLVAQGCTFLLLDEPINHLDIPSRARFEQALANFKGTILAVVHDRYFIERFASDVWNVEDGKITSRRSGVRTALLSERSRSARTKENIMKTISPTPHPDVNAILNLLHSNVKEILQDQFVGMYLFGSLANGDFDQHSDIDVLVVTTNEIADDIFSSLHVMHTRVANIASPWATQMEISYIPQKAVRRYDPADKLHPHLDRGQGERLHWMAHESDWIIQRHILRERGIILEGPAPQSLIDPISATDLQQAVVHVLPYWAMPILEDPLQIKSRGYQSFIVLSLCRMLYTLQCGTIISKRAAADWAQQALSKQWTPLIARAWLGRQNSGSYAHPEEVDGTLNFIRFTMEYSRKMEYPKK